MDVVSLGLAKSDARKYGARPNTIVWLGDSLTFNGGRVPASTSYNPNGFWCWAQFFLGHRLQTVKNSGIQGETSAQILARVQADVIAYAPGWCHVLAGTNDIGQAVPVATAQANIAAIWDALDQRGIRVVAGTIPPRNTYTGTMLADTLTLNNWIRAQGRSRRNLIVVDYYAAVCSPSGNGWANTAESGQSTTPDGVHPGNAGAPRMGRALANVLSPLLPPTPTLFSSEGDTSNVLPYSRFIAGTVGSATPPTGWAQSVTGGPLVYSRVPRTDGIMGSWLQVVVPVGASGNINNPNALLTANRFAIGDTLVGTIEIQRSAIDQAVAASTSGVNLQLVAVGPNAFISDMNWTFGSSDNQPIWDHAGILRTPPLVVPAGTTQMKLQLAFGGGQTLNLDRAGIVNLTRGGIPA